MNDLDRKIILFGQISQEVYDKKLFMADLDEIKICGKKYEILDWINDEVNSKNWFGSGLQAILLKNDNEYIIAFAGTNQYEKTDLLNDVLIPIYSPQLTTALIWTNKMIEKHQIKKENLILTGHSLGGIETQYVGYHLKIKGFAFNPYGINNLFTKVGNKINKFIDKIFDNELSDNLEFAKNNIYNISFQDTDFINGDILSNLATNISSEHFGKIIPIFGENVGILDGHSIENLNKVIAKYAQMSEHYNMNFNQITQNIIDKINFNQNKLNYIDHKATIEHYGVNLSLISAKNVDSERELYTNLSQSHSESTKFQSNLKERVMGNKMERQPRVRQEIKPSFRNEFHKYDHYLSYAIDSYNLNSKKIEEASVIKEQTRHHHTYGFQARAYETKDEMIVAVRGTEMTKWRDLLTDGKLASGGHPKGQIEQLIKFFEEKDENGKTLIEQLREAKKSGKHIVIAGHSLGGYLAQVATQIYPDIFNEYYGYQAPSANFKDWGEIVEKNGKYYERTPSQVGERGELKYNDKELPDNLGRGLFQLQQSIANKTCKTNFFDIRADTDWAVIANLHNRERFGNLIKVAGESHSSPALSKILRLYDVARHLGMRDAEKNVTDTLEKIYRTTTMPISEIADNLIKEIGRQRGITNTNVEKIYNELIEKPRSIAMRDLNFQNVDKNIERLPYARRDVPRHQDLYKVNFSKIVSFEANNQNNTNLQNYKMTQSDYQNMVNGFESMSIR